jgi:hypothetical protein
MEFLRRAIVTNLKRNNKNLSEQVMPESFRVLQNRTGAFHPTGFSRGMKRDTGFYKCAHGKPSQAADGVEPRSNFLLAIAA